MLQSFINKVTSPKQLERTLTLVGVTATLNMFRKHPNRKNYKATIDAIRTRRTQILNQLKEERSNVR